MDKIKYLQQVSYLHFQHFDNPHSLSRYVWQSDVENRKKISEAKKQALTEKAEIDTVVREELFEHGAKIIGDIKKAAKSKKVEYGAFKIKPENQNKEFQTTLEIGENKSQKTVFLRFKEGRRKKFEPESFAFDETGPFISFDSEAKWTMTGTHWDIEAAYPGGEKSSTYRYKAKTNRHGDVKQGKITGGRGDKTKLSELETHRQDQAEIQAKAVAAKEAQTQESKSELAQLNELIKQLNAPQQAVSYNYAASPNFSMASLGHGFAMQATNQYIQNAARQSTHPHVWSCNNQNVPLQMAYPQNLYGGNYQYNYHSPVSPNASYYRGQSLSYEQKQTNIENKLNSKFGSAALFDKAMFMAIKQGANKDNVVSKSIDIVLAEDPANAASYRNYLSHSAAEKFRQGLQKRAENMASSIALAYKLGDSDQATVKDAFMKFMSGSNAPDGMKINIYNKICQYKNANGVVNKVISNFNLPAATVTDLLEEAEQKKDIAKDQSKTDASRAEKTNTKSSTTAVNDRFEQVTLEKDRTVLKGIYKPENEGNPTLQKQKMEEALRNSVLKYRQKEYGGIDLTQVAGADPDAVALTQKPGAEYDPNKPSFTETYTRTLLEGEINNFVETPANKNNAVKINTKVETQKPTYDLGLDDPTKQAKWNNTMTKLDKKIKNTDVKQLNTIAKEAAGDGTKMETKLKESLQYSFDKLGKNEQAEITKQVQQKRNKPGMEKVYQDIVVPGTGDKQYNYKTNKQDLIVFDKETVVKMMTDPDASYTKVSKQFQNIATSNPVKRTEKIVKSEPVQFNTLTKEKETAKTLIELQKKYPEINTNDRIELVKAKKEANESGTNYETVVKQKLSDDITFSKAFREQANDDPKFDKVITKAGESIEFDFIKRYTTDDKPLIERVVKDNFDIDEVQVRTVNKEITVNDVITYEPIIADPEVDIDILINEHETFEEDNAIDESPTEPVNPIIEGPTVDPDNPITPEIIVTPVNGADRITVNEIEGVKGAEYKWEYEFVDDNQPVLNEVSLSDKTTLQYNKKIKDEEVVNINYEQQQHGRVDIKYGSENYNTLVEVADSKIIATQKVESWCTETCKRNNDTGTVSGLGKYLLKQARAKGEPIPAGLNIHNINVRYYNHPRYAKQLAKTKKYLSWLKGKNYTICKGENCMASGVNYSLENIIPNATNSEQDCLKIDYYERKGVKGFDLLLRNMGQTAYLEKINGVYTLVISGSDHKGCGKTTKTVTKSRPTIDWNKSYTWGAWTGTNLDPDKTKVPSIQKRALRTQIRKDVNEKWSTISKIQEIKNFLASGYYPNENAKKTAVVNYIISELGLTEGIQTHSRTETKTTPAVYETVTKTINFGPDYDVDFNTNKDELSDEQKKVLNAYGKSIDDYIKDIDEDKREHYHVAIFPYRKSNETADSSILKKRYNVIRAYLISKHPNLSDRIPTDYKKENYDKFDETNYWNTLKDNSNPRAQIKVFEQYTTETEKHIYTFSKETKDGTREKTFTANTEQAAWNKLKSYQPYKDLQTDKSGFNESDVRKKNNSFEIKKVEAKVELSETAAKELDKVILKIKKAIKEQEEKGAVNPVKIALNYGQFDGIGFNNITEEQRLKQTLIYKYLSGERKENPTNLNPIDKKYFVSNTFPFGGIKKASLGERIEIHYSNEAQKITESDKNITESFTFNKDQIKEAQDQLKPIKEYLDSFMKINTKAELNSLKKELKKFFNSNDFKTLWSNAKEQLKTQLSETDIKKIETIITSIDQYIDKITLNDVTKFQKEIKPFISVFDDFLNIQTEADFNEFIKNVKNIKNTNAEEISENEETETVSDNETEKKVKTPSIISKNKEFFADKAKWKKLVPPKGLKLSIDGKLVSIEKAFEKAHDIANKPTKTNVLGLSKYESFYELITNPDGGKYVRHFLEKLKANATPGSALYSHLSNNTGLTQFIDNTTGPLSLSFLQAIADSKTNLEPKYREADFWGDLTEAPEEGDTYLGSVTNWISQGVSNVINAVGDFEIWSGMALFKSGTNYAIDSDEDGEARILYTFSDVESALNENMSFHEIK